MCPIHVILDTLDGGANGVSAAEVAVNPIPFVSGSRKSFAEVVASFSD